MSVISSSAFSRMFFREDLLVCAIPDFYPIREKTSASPVFIARGSWKTTLRRFLWEPANPRSSGYCFILTSPCVHVVAINWSGSPETNLTGKIEYRFFPSIQDGLFGVPFLHMPANLEAPKPLNSLLFALFAWLNCIHARGQIMLLFAYGSHACPYGDWSKEEKLTYVGGLFSCSLQVNFSSHLF